MDISQFKEHLCRAVRERGGLVLPGTIEVSSVRSREPLLTVKTQDIEPHAWAELVVHGKPPVVWIAEQDISIEEPWLAVEDWIPPDVESKLGKLSKSEARQFDTLRKELCALCKNNGPASLEVTLIVDGVVHTASYEADWVKQANEKVDSLLNLLPEDEEPEADQRRIRALERVLEQEIIAALVASNEFGYCTTIKQRLVCARSVVQEFMDREGYDAIVARLEEIAEMAFIKLRARQAAGKGTKR